MIDLSQLTEEELNELELQIQKHKEQQQVKNALENLKGYKVTFYMRFDPEKHKNDLLTNGEELDTDFFEDYLDSNVTGKLYTDLNFRDYEDVSYPIVEVATQQDIENQF